MRKLLDFARDLLVRNWWLKLAALLLAYVLWLLVRSAEGERVLTVPLVVRVPRNMEIVGERPATVEASVLGVPNLAGNLPELTYTINLQSAAEGEITVPLSTDGIQLSPGAGVSVVHVNPARMTFSLERVISRDLPVKVPILGVPAPGYDLYGVSSQPDIIHVVGPRSRINALTEAATDPMSVAGLKHSLQRTVNFDLQSDDIHTSPVTVEVNVEVGVHRIEKTFSLPVAVLGGGGFIASPAAVMVSALVPLSLEGKLSAADFRAMVFAPSEEPLPSRVLAKPEVEFRGDLGRGIMIRKVQPEAVTLTLNSGKK
jgi:hypothetical protein